MFRFIATTPDTMSGANIPRNLRLLSSILRRLRVIFLSYFLHCWCVINFHLKSIFNLKHSDSCSWLSSWDSRKKKIKNAIVALQVYLVSRLFLLMQRNASMDVFSLMFLRVCFCCLHMKVFYFCGTACYSLKKKKICLYTALKSVTGSLSWGGELLQEHCHLNNLSLWVYFHLLN